MECCGGDLSDSGSSGYWSWDHGNVSPAPSPSVTEMDRSPDRPTDEGLHMELGQGASEEPEARRCKVRKRQLIQRANRQHFKLMLSKCVWLTCCLSSLLSEPGSIQVSVAWLWKSADIACRHEAAHSHSSPRVSLLAQTQMIHLEHLKASLYFCMLMVGLGSHAHHRTLSCSFKKNVTTCRNSDECDENCYQWRVWVGRRVVWVKRYFIAISMRFQQGTSSHYMGISQAM